METQLKLLFPTIVKVETEENKYSGVLQNNENELIFVEFTVPNYPTSKCITFKTSTELTESFKTTLTSKSESLDFLAFLKLFSQLLTTETKKPNFQITHFTKFYSEYQELKSKYPQEQFLFDSANETFSIISVDKYSVENLVKIQLNFCGADEFKLYQVIEHSFPDTKLFAKENNLTVIHKQFLHYIESFSEFHNVMQQIDMLCWVTAPPNPTFQHNYRTIMIAENSVSMKITFNPWDMTKLPEFKFFGPSKLIEVHRNNLSENLKYWDPDYDVLQNILKLLDMPFFLIKPTEKRSEKQEIILYDKNTECCICFNYYLNENTPDVVCEFESCRSQFHNECLYEWLSIMPDYRIFFGTISGECPNCEKSISCIDK